MKYDFACAPVFEFKKYANGSVRECGSYEYLYFLFNDETKKVFKFEPGVSFYGIDMNVDLDDPNVFRTLRQHNGISEITEDFISCYKGHYPEKKSEKFWTVIRYLLCSYGKDKGWIRIFRVKFAYPEDGITKRSFFPFQIPVVDLLKEWNI